MATNKKRLPEKEQAEQKQQEQQQPGKTPAEQEPQPKQAGAQQAQQPIKPGDNNEQMLRRQSGPRPTARDWVAQQQMSQSQNINNGLGGTGAIDGFAALTEVIGKEQLHKATLTLQKYREGKANLERRIVTNEQWYKLRHWECLRGNDNSEVQPASGWLFNAIANKHADAMDSFPEPNILPREETDKAEAERLTSIVPVILQQNDFEEIYSEVWNYKLKTGTGVYGVFWDKSKLNGLGDISVQKVDILCLFWEPGITDIQKSRNLFHVELCDNEVLQEMYPQLAGKLGTSTIDISKYIYDDSVDTSDKSAIIDWYYKKNVNGKQVLHYCKYVNDEVLFSTENTPEYRERGWYDHGLYPFIFDPLYTVEGTPAGFGYVDIGKNAQEYIDRGGQAILQNMLANSKPRHFIRNDGAVNEAEYADLTKDFIHVDGNLGSDSILPVTGKALDDIYVDVINNKIEELKETTGNRDVNTGGSTSGVTAASAIAAMQEQGSKLSRDNSKAAYRAYRRLVLMVIELIRQFYDLPRCFRIMGPNASQRFIQYTNANLQAQQQESMFGMDFGQRVPLFDVEVSAQKNNPYSKMSQNELALQFFQLGFFNPQMSDQALACLEMMDFNRKESIMQRIQQNGTMMQMIMQLQQQMLALGGIVDQAHGSNEITAGLMNQFGMEPQAAPAGGDGKKPEIQETDGLGELKQEEHPFVEKARQQAADRTAPK